MTGALTSVGLVACTIGQPVTPTPEALSALYVVNDGPYPLYANSGEWAAARPRGVPLGEADKQTIEAGRIARAQRRIGTDDRAWLLKGCIFDVQTTSADQQDPRYVWAYGRVARCDEPVEDGVLEPQMGVRPEKLRIYDGQVGYFPMSLLDVYTGRAPTPRQ
jgi:hypothetical protein